MHFHAPKDISSEEAALISSGRIVPSTPIRLNLMEGGRRLDLLGDSLIAFDICSVRLLGVLHQFSGTGMFPLRLFDKKEAEITGYKGLSVHGFCGPPDWKKARPCTILKKAPMGSSQPGRAGIPIEWDTWDGADVFRPQNTTMTLVTKNVRDAIETMGATNVYFRSIEEYAVMDVSKL